MSWSYSLILFASGVDSSSTAALSKIWVNVTVVANSFHLYAVVFHRFDEVVSYHFIFIGEFTLLRNFTESCMILRHTFINLLGKISELKSGIVFVFPR